MKLETYWALKRFGAKKKGDVVKIYVEGKWKRATYIGQGMFSTVFRYGRSDVFIYSMFNDNSKEILSFSQCDNPHIPVMRKLKFIEGPELQHWDINVFQSKFYHVPVLSKIGPAYHHMMTLSACQSLAQRKASSFDRRELEYCRTVNKEFVNSVKTDPEKLPGLLREAVEHIGQTVANYRCVRFGDIHRSNVGTDGRGRLVLLDIIFDDLLVGSMVSDLAKAITSRELRKWKKTYE